jgi:purine-binding chemotaxis protein CheW
MELVDNKYVIFSLQADGIEMNYGVSIRQVQEIRRPLPVTIVPNLPAFAKGIVNLRGMVLPLIDLKKCFHFGETVISEDTRIIVISFDGKSCAVLVDDVEEIIKLNQEEIGEPPQLVKDNADFLIGVSTSSEQIISLLDFTSLLGNRKVKNSETNIVN